MVIKNLNLIIVMISILFSNIIAQDLPIIAVTKIKSSVDSGRYYDYKNSKSENFQNMLETQLVKLGRFKIIERNRVDEVLSEQALQGNFSNNNTQLAVGEVDYIVYGAITKFGSKRKQIKTGDFISVQIISEFGIDLKIVSALDGEIIKAENVDVVLITGDGIATGDFSNVETKADPLSDIQRKAARMVSAIIAEGIYPIRVITYKDEQDNCCAYLNYGSAMFENGDQVSIRRPGESMIDPETGIDLGSTEEVIGIMEVIEVTEKFSKAKLIDGKKPSKKDLVRIVDDKIKQKTQRKTRGKKLWITLTKIVELY